MSRIIKAFGLWITLSGPWVAGLAFSQGSLQIPSMERPPTLEDFSGMKPSEEIRDMMARIDGFIQREPDDGELSAQRTEAYVAYDQINFYVVFLAFDDEPHNVRANLSPREIIWDDDKIGITIDTFNDQRTAYMFRANPFGVQQDARWREGGRMDTSYESVWHSEGRLTDQGFMVRFAIPFRSLRFSESDEQVWGIQVEREIVRLSENSFWPAYSRSVEGRLNQVATLVGINDVSPGRNIQLVPFAFVRDFEVLDSKAKDGSGFTKDTEDNFGLDAKFVFGDSMVLDATINPDFSQVESDQPQVTVNERFEVRFPERRPFFLENSDYFSTERRLVFTRRIKDPQAGLRFTGKQGPWGFGVMLMDDEAPGQNRPLGDPLSGQPADVRIMRVYRDIGEQSSFGALLTDKKFGNASNTVVSLDGRFKLTPNWTNQVQLINTDTRLQNGTKLNGTMSSVRFDRSGRSFNVHAHRLDTSEDFKAELGYFSRDDSPDSQSTHARLSYVFWPRASRLNKWGPTLFVNRIEDQSGTRLFSQVTPSFSWEWAADTEFEVEYDKTRERLRPQDFSGLTGSRDYAQDRWSLEFETEMFARVSFSAEFESGTTINLKPISGAEPTLANTASTEIEVSWKPSDNFRIDTTYLLTELADRGGAGDIFSNRIVRTRWNYQFTKEFSLRFIAQHEKTDPTALTSLKREENMNFDVLLRYVINPWSALYFGYNSNSSNFQLIDTENGKEVIRTTDLDRDGEQLFLKFSYLLQP